MNSRFEMRPLGEVLELDLEECQVASADEYEVAGVYSFGRGSFARRTMAGSETSYKTLNRLRANHVVLSRLKAFEGAIAVVPESFDGWLLSPEFPTFRCIPGRAVPGYMRHVCRWPEFWDRLSATSKGVGARRERVHAERFLSLALPIPDVDEQVRVAARLDRFSQLESDMLRLVDAASAYPAAVLHSARQALACADVATGSTHSTCDLGELAHFLNGTSYDTGQLHEDGMPIIRISNITDSSSDFVRTNQVFDSRFSVEEGDLLVSWSASFKTIIWSGPRGILNQHIFRVTETEGIDKGFLRHLIEAVFDEMREQAVGIGMMHLRREAFLKQRVRVPDLPTQRSIAQRLDRIETHLRDVRDQHSRMRTLLGAHRNSILNRAFAGLM